MNAELTETEGFARRIARWVTGRALPRFAYPVVRGPLRGRRFLLGSAAGAGGGASVYFGLMEPEKTRALSGILSPGQVFFDIGANIGYYTVLAAGAVGPTGRVVAVEPLPRNLSYLHRHLALNKAANVMVVPAACADRSGLSLFVPGTSCATGALQERASGQSGSSADAAVAVATTTVDDVVAVTGLTPHILKIDVEGAEVQVLSGAKRTLKTARPAILLGVHSETLRVECARYLADYGYEGVSVCDDANGDAEVLFTARERPGQAQ